MEADPDCVLSSVFWHILYMIYACVRKQIILICNECGYAGGLTWSQSGCIVWVISVQLDQAGLRSRAALMQMQKTDDLKSVQIVFACNYKTGSLGAGGCWGLATQLWAFSGSSVCIVWDSQRECRFQLLVCFQIWCCCYLTIKQQATIQCRCPQQQLKPSGPCWEGNLELFQNGGTKMEGKQPIRVSLLGLNRV